jgi:DNA-binding Lrp family transcriptional regulator
MEKIKDIDYKLLYELMKDSRRSDRQIAKVLKSSQPTITRRRAMLEKELIDGYTAIPRWEKLGYEIFAITLVKAKSTLGSREKFESARKKGIEWLMDQPNIIMGGGCRGSGINSFMISIHRSYHDYDVFMNNYRLELGDTIDDVQTILVNLRGKELLKPLQFKYLTEAK